VVDVLPERVAQAREFNRFYTAVIGVLQEGLMRTPFTLTEARVLFELAHRESARTPAIEVTALRRDLGLDAGYLSRMLARFEADGLITRERVTGDARRQAIALTDLGRAAFRTLDRRSAADVGKLLGRLGEADQRRLLGAMGTIQELLGQPTQRDMIVLRPPAPGDLGWVVQRHGARYTQEYGWDQTFEALVARIVADYAERHDPARDADPSYPPASPKAAWIAEVDGAPVGCVFCVAKDDTTAQLRLLLVEPDARGMGVGTRLVDECLRFATRAGYKQIMLWTNDVLSSARRIYQRAGFKLVEEEKHHSYGHDLVGQIWSRPL
jgi:DNA-binding MarR family transcriptional regulator/GNAT superfamily N-acetyltransferase